MKSSEVIIIGTVVVAALCGTVGMILGHKSSRSTAAASGSAPSSRKQGQGQTQLSSSSSSSSSHYSSSRSSVKQEGQGKQQSSPRHHQLPIDDLEETIMVLFDSFKEDDSHDARTQLHTRVSTLSLITFLGIYVSMNHIPLVAQNPSVDIDPKFINTILQFRKMLDDVLQQKIRSEKDIATQWLKTLDPKQYYQSVILSPDFKSPNEIFNNIFVADISPQFPKKQLATMIRNLRQKKEDLQQKQAALLRKKKQPPPIETAIKNMNRYLGSRINDYQKILDAMEARYQSL